MRTFFSDDQMDYLAVIEQGLVGVKHKLPGDHAIVLPRVVECDVPDADGDILEVLAAAPQQAAMPGTLHRQRTVIIPVDLTNTHTYTHAHTRTHKYTDVHAYAQIYTHTHTQIYAQMHTQVHMHKHAYTPIHPYTHTHISS